MNKKDYFKCVVCGKVTAGRMAVGGDGTFYFPRRHKRDGKPCPGNFCEAKWVRK